ncbi:hypothetical protein CCYA_CCYA17G4334 [Cyanidiococcus yangmingshanensis]|nr:hypothetical protein CCYA_CCYA17G4334 [Cyanidiococcus yangmingshanensis]
MKCRPEIAASSSPQHSPCKQSEPVEEKSSARGKQRYFTYWFIGTVLLCLGVSRLCLLAPERVSPSSVCTALRKVELLTLREIVGLLGNVEKKTSSMWCASQSSVTIVLNVFLRPKAFQRVLDGIRMQSAIGNIVRVIVVALGSPFVHEFTRLLEEYRVQANWPSDIPIALISSGPDFNPGYYGRFLLSMNLNTTFTFIIDDDIVLGERFLELCIRWSCLKSNGIILGQRGARYYRNRIRRRLLPFHASRLSPNKYHDFLGEHGLLRRADVLFSAWFMKTKWISRMFHEEPLTWETAEDIHLCMSLRLRFGIESLAFPIDPQLPEFRLNRFPSIEMENRSWSDSSTAIVQLRDAVVDKWLSEEHELQPKSFFDDSWTRKDMYWQSMPLIRGSTYIETPHSSANSRNSSTNLLFLWRPFACYQLGFSFDSSIPRMSLPGCRALRYRQPWIGIAKSYFGHWGCGFQADSIFWGRPKSYTYREHVGYLLEIFGNGHVEIDGVLYGDAHARFLVWDAKRDVRLVDSRLAPNESFQLPVVVRELPTKLLFMFSESSESVHEESQRKVYDEIRIRRRVDGRSTVVT